MGAINDVHSNEISELLKTNYTLMQQHHMSNGARFLKDHKQLTTSGAHHFYPTNTIVNQGYTPGAKNYPYYG